MCLFKKKKKETFQEWNNSTDNFGFNERNKKLLGSFQKQSSNITNQSKDATIPTKSDSNEVKNDNNSVNNDKIDK